MNSYLGHLREADIKFLADAVRYCTYFSCQCNGCSIVVGIRNLWVKRFSHGVPDDTDLTFTERLNELDEFLFKVTKREKWSTSKRWNCGNCVGNRYQYDVGNRHGYLKDHREELDACIIEYSQDALKRFSGVMPVSFNHQEQVQEYKRMMDTIAICPKFDINRLSTFQTCLLFQTLAITGVLPLQCYEFSEIDNMKGPFTLIRSVYNSDIQARTKKNNGTRKVRPTVNAESNKTFIKIKKSLSGKGQNQMAISRITHEFLENVLCKISGYLKSSLCPDKASKGQNEDAFTARLRNVKHLLAEPCRERLHEIVKDVSNVGTCKKWDHHFYDNEMKKVSNLFRVRPTSNGSRSILEVRSSTNSDTLSFCIKFNAENYNVNYASLIPVFRLMYK